MTQSTDSTTAITPATSAPRLWNPGAAASWSLLFSPVFGAILHMKNWEAMGETEKASQSRKWAVGSATALLAVIVISVILPNSRALDLLARAFGLALLLSWYYSSGKLQSAAVLARYGKSYPRRGWAKPLLYATLAFIGFIVGLTVFGFVLDTVIGSI